MKNLGSVMEAARAKANDAMEAAKSTAARVAEAAGVSERGADDEPAIRQHYETEDLLRKLGKDSEAYIKAMRSMCEATHRLGEDFNQAAAALPELQEAASQFAAATQLQRQLAVLSQAVNQLVAVPIQAELDGRKDLDKRLSDRKRVRADYEAYRKKQMTLANTDPSNAQVYTSNLEAAHQTFSKHSEGVVREVKVVNRERAQRACSSLLAIVAGHSAFFGVANSTLDHVSSSLGAVFEAIPQMGTTYGQVRTEIQKQPIAKAEPVRAAPPSDYSPPTSRSSPPPKTSPTAPRAAKPPPAAAARAASAPAPPPPLIKEDSSDFDPFGINSPKRKPEPPLAAAARAASDEADLLGGFASAPSPPTSADDDLLAGFASAPPSVTGSNGPSVGADLDLMGSDMSAMDDLNALSAPPALAPTTVPQPRMRASTMPPAPANDMDFFNMGGAPAQSVQQPRSASTGEPNLMGGLGSPVGMGGDPFGMGSMMGADPFGGSGIDPNEPGARERLRLQKEQQKAAAIADKVNALKEKEAQAENNRETERELEKGLKQKVASWQREKKNLRSLLASLHEIAPPCSWKPMSLGELLDAGAVKKAYRKALLAVHPDKQDAGDLSAKVLAQLIFDALRDAWHAFEQTG